MKRPNVEVAIGELELVGFPAAHRHAIAGAVQRTLVELLAEQTLPAIPRAPTREAEAAFTLNPHDTPEHVGRAIAEALFRTLAVRGRPTP
jgi:hypothetical protein